MVRRVYDPVSEEDECGMPTDADPNSAGYYTGETNSADPGTSAAGAADQRSLAQDWTAIWQSELAALAADPEQHEFWQAIVALWAGPVSALLSGLSAAAHDGKARRPGPDDAPRPAPADAAPDARDAEIGRIARHLAALERRLASIERGGHPGVDAKRRPRRKRGG